MKTFCLLLMLCLCSLVASAQTNTAARLAIVSETPDTSTAVDLLTAEFSKTANLQLLERNEIDRIYREQGLSGGNGDYVKLGKLLGADGLLLFKTSSEGTNRYLNIRLVAVKQGVVLAAERFNWPLPDLTGWSPRFAKHVEPLLGKLSVKSGDAIPISVVNLRSAVSSQAAKETETQLKLLAIERLSREPQFFVLERQRLELLANEKDLNADASEFWKGSYLLEGVVDQNGYTPDTITIDARLTPSKGGAPIPIKISGGRKNLGEVINQLTVKISEALKINNGATAWNPAEEAKQYFDEATWALKWKVYREAQSAAESAWALGKQDLECALLRVRSYIEELPGEIGDYEHEGSGIAPGFNKDGTPIGPDPTDAEMEKLFQKETVGKHRTNFLYQEIRKPGSRDFDFVFPKKLPASANVDKAAYALGLYLNFSKINPDGVPTILHKEHTSTWRDSDWYKLGIDCLEAASKVLQHYSFVPEQQQETASKLADLRAQTRAVDKLIRETPDIHESYFVGNNSAEYDRLDSEFCENPSVFKCELNWGCYWHEKPQDTIELYRDLLSSPVFCYLHKDFWFRETERPRLIAWNDGDRGRIPALWRSFSNELASTTKVLVKLEGKALCLADAANEAGVKQAFTNFFDFFFANREVLMTSRVDVLHLDWGAGDLVEGLSRGAASADVSESLEQQYHTDFYRKIEAMHNEYLEKTIPKLHTEARFPLQKKYLLDKKPLAMQEFWKMFPSDSSDYSREQALEILPLIEAYESNLAASAEGDSPQKKFKAKSDINSVEFFLGKKIRQIINPEPVKPPVQTQVKPASPTPPAASPPVAHSPIGSQDIITNVIEVNTFLEIPTNTLVEEQISDLKVSAHHWVENRLLFDFHYVATEYTFDKQGRWAGTSYPSFCGIAVLSPSDRKWEVVSYRAEELAAPTALYDCTTLYRGQIFTSNFGKIRRYNRSSKQWEILPVSQDDNFELFNVNDHLYAAKNDIIFEITDHGNSSQILASTRRRPAASALDTEDWGMPALFEGQNHNLRVQTKNKIFTWTGKDWQQDFAFPPNTHSIQTFKDGVIFHQTSRQGSEEIEYTSLLGYDTNSPLLCLTQRVRLPYMQTPFPRPQGNVPPAPNPHWNAKMPPFLAGVKGTDLFFMEYHGKIKRDPGQLDVIVQSMDTSSTNFNLSLYWLCYELKEPIKLGLNFGVPDAAVPIPTYDSMMYTRPPAWMLLTSNLAFFGMDAPQVFAMNFADQLNRGKRPGVWSLPISKLEDAAVIQKSLLREKQSRLEQAESAEKQKLLAKYDTDHNGLIDPAERGAAFDDRAFLQSELDSIDTNHNGYLDAAELNYFDANSNKILEEKEQSGIELTQELLAARVLKQYDLDGDGKLDGGEFNAFIADSTASDRIQFGVMQQFPDSNGDRFIDREELLNFLKKKTRTQLLGFTDPRTRIQSMSDSPGQPVNPRTMFKNLVENYWQNPVATNGFQRFNRPMRLGTGMQTMPGTTNRATEAGTVTNQP